MERFSPEKRDLESLRQPLLKQTEIVSQALRENYPGLEIDSEGRVVAQQPKKVSWQIQPQLQTSQILGELLELMKFIKINSENSDLITIRTSLYDDFFNHVDEIIYDKETLQPLMAIDITTTSQKEIQLNKLTKLIKMINQGGGQVKYGFVAKKKAENIVFQKQSLRQIPVFIVHMTAQELIAIIKGQEFNFSNWLKNLLKEQSEEIIKIIDEQLKIARKEDRRALESLRNRYFCLQERF